MTAMLGRPWLIEPNEFERIVSLEPQQGEYYDSDDRNGRERPYVVEGATAVIPVTGVLVAKQDLFSFFMMGATSYPEIEEALMAAKADASVETIRLEFDSPGGDAMGVQRLGDLIYGCKKRVEALAVGQCQSAAYWLASQCDAISAAPSAIVGSIGTVMKIRSDASKEGLVVFRSSPAKHADPASKEGASQYQQIVDDLTQLFVENVARGREVSEQEVRDSYGDGASMIASRALAAGLIDGIQDTAQAVSDSAIMSSSAKQGAMMTDIRFTAEEFEALQAENASLAEKIEGFEARLADLEPKSVADELRTQMAALEVSHAEAIEALKTEGVEALKAAEDAKAKAEEDLAVGTLLARGIVTKAEEAEAREAYSLRESHPTFWNKLANRATPEIPLEEVGHGVEGAKPEPKIEGLGAENFAAVDGKVKAYCEANGLDHSNPQDYITALGAVKEAL